MLKKIYDKFRAGVEKIKWFAALFSERLNIEIAVFQLLFKSDEMERKRDALLRSIGERVVELKGQGDKISRDSAIAGALEEIEKIDRNIMGLKQKANEISRVTG
jgi:seryl-tRNA synthetase